MRGFNMIMKDRLTLTPWTALLVVLWLLTVLGLLLAVLLLIVLLTVLVLSVLRLALTVGVASVLGRSAIRALLLVVPLVGVVGRWRSAVTLLLAVGWLPVTALLVVLALVVAVATLIIVRAGHAWKDRSSRGLNVEAVG